MTRPFQVRPVRVPVMGWTVRQPQDETNPSYAQIVDNFLSDGQGLDLRGGSSEHATGLGSGNVEAAFSHADPDGTKTLIGCANNKLYDCTTSGAGSDITGGLTITSNRWQGHNFNGKLVLVNGADTPIEIDKTTPTALTITGTGLTSSNLVQGTSFRQRQYFIEKDSTDVWYLAGNSISGTATKFPVGDYLQRGGFLQAVGQLSTQGDKRQNLFVVASELGEILIYEGDFPGNVFELSHKYTLAPTLGRRCMTNVGSDLYIATTAGVYSLLRLLGARNLNEEQDAIIVSWEINPKVIELAGQNKDLLGWDVTFYPDQSLFLLNVPIANNSEYHQYVQRTYNGAWHRFRGWEAHSWVVHDGELYFGSSGGKMFKALDGDDDDGDAIVYDLLYAYQPFGGLQKTRFVEARPHIELTTTNTVGIHVETDFQSLAKSNYVSMGRGSSTPWFSPWYSPWSDPELTNKDWYGLEGDGYFGALRIFGSLSDATMRVNSTLIRFEPTTQP